MSDALRPGREVLSLLAKASSQGLISVPKAAESLGIPNRAAALKLASLARSGWVVRAQRGLYMIRPLEAASASVPVAEDPWVLARELFSPCYIGGWTALGHWGLTEQIFRSTFVVTAAERRKSDERRLSAEFHTAHVSLTSLQGTVVAWRGSEQVQVSDRERTIADALVNPSWVGGVTHLIEVLGTYRASEHFSPAKLIARANEAGSGAAFKRLGYLAETLWPEIDVLISTALQRRTKGVIRLDPAIHFHGKMSKRWGLWVNVAKTDDP